MPGTFGEVAYCSRSSAMISALPETIWIRPRLDTAIMKGYIHCVVDVVLTVYCLVLFQQKNHVVANPFLNCILVFRFTNT